METGRDSAGAIVNSRLGHTGRRPGPPRVFLTGGTGFLGSHIGAELLRRGYRVTFLARPTPQHSAEQRVGRVLVWHGVPTADRERAQVVAGDLTKPGLGIEPAAREGALDAGVQIVHCASDTSFLERDRDRVVAANVGGLRHLLEVAAAGCAAFHHLSTAYVAGRHTGACREQLVRQVDFHNVYEETKCRAEWLASEICQAEDIPLTIYRPSICYGHSRTGRALRFDAFYYPMRTAHLVRRLFERDILQRDGERARHMGVCLERDGAMFVPVRIEASANGGLNLIPIDYLVAAFLALMETPLAGRIYHIANARTERLETLVDYTRSYFRLGGLRACTGGDCSTPPRSELETLVDGYLEPYGPYMRDTRTFDCAHSSPILERLGIACPALDYAVFQRCIDYALQVNWTVSLETSSGPNRG
jgi:nucleoside-diphosphate-sugar epimerase